MGWKGFQHLSKSWGYHKIILLEFHPWRSMTCFFYGRSGWHNHWKRKVMIMDCSLSMWTKIILRNICVKWEATGVMKSQLFYIMLTLYFFKKTMMTIKSIINLFDACNFSKFVNGISSNICLFLMCYYEYQSSDINRLKLNIVHINIL